MIAAWVKEFGHSTTWLWVTILLRRAAAKLTFENFENLPSQLMEMDEGFVLFAIGTPDVRFSPKAGI